jgi:diguanylate cyclase (GGDEF) domain
MHEFAKELFLNAMIMIAFITLGNQLFREKIATPTSTMQRKIWTGFVAGLLGCLLMLFSVHVTSDMYLDLRNLPIIMMALYTTFPSAIVASLVIGLFRITYFGINQSSIIAFVAAICIGIGCGLIGKLSLRRSIKWILSILMAFIVAAIGFSLLLNDLSLLSDVIVAYYGILTVASILLYFLLENITEANRIYSQMKDEAKKDFLTGLNNVRQFDTLLNKAISEANEKNENLSFLFIDVDFFKKVNDTYGHTEGDLVLKQLSDIIKNACRSFDVVSRNGGEEFSAILLDCPLDRAVKVAERVRNNIEHHGFILGSGQEIKMTVSIGVSSYPEDTLDAEKLVEYADIALYNAKREGRNIVSTKRSL